jgi:hypothetical protein
LAGRPAEPPLSASFRALFVLRPEVLSPRRDETGILSLPSVSTWHSALNTHHQPGD